MEVKTATPKEKFNWIKEWHPYFFSQIRRDIKNEHLRNDPGFAKKYLGKTLPKAEVEELVDGYRKAIEDGRDEIIDFLFQSWLMKKGDIYLYFAEELSKISEDFTTLESIDKEKADDIAERACHQFGALDTTIFALINGVVFPPALFDELKKKSNKEEKTKKENAQEQSKLKEKEDLINDYELKIQRLTDKYEKKLLGLEKKYQTDVAALKKQIKK